MTPQITVIVCGDLPDAESPYDPSIYGSVTVLSEGFELAANVVRSALRDAHMNACPRRDLAAFDCMQRIVRRRDHDGCDVRIDPVGSAHTTQSEEAWIVWFDRDDMLVHRIGAEQVRFEDIMCIYASDAELVMADALGRFEFEDEERSSEYAAHMRSCDYIS